MKYKIGQKVRYVYSYETSDLKRNHVYTIVDITPPKKGAFSCNYNIKWYGSNNYQYSINSYNCDINKAFLIPITEYPTLEIL